VKKLVLLFITVFCMCYMVACGGETNDTANVGGSKEVLGNSADDNPVVTEAPTVEPEVTPAPAEVTPEPTEVPVEEATPESTEEPSVVYEGIDMDSTLNGQDWLETFVGIVDEPKVVVFSDVSGKKVIVEQDGEVVINPDEDAIALYLPDNFYYANVYQGIEKSQEKNTVETDFCIIFYLDSNKMREKEDWKAAFLVKSGEEKHPLSIKIKIE